VGQIGLGQSVSLASVPSATYVSLWVWLAPGLAGQGRLGRIPGRRGLEIVIFGNPRILYPKLTFSYTRPRGKQPDYTAPVVLRNGKNTVRNFCDAIHKNIVPNFKNGEFGSCRYQTTLFRSLSFLLINSLPLFCALNHTVGC